MLLINRAGDYLTEQTGFGATSRYTAFGKVEQWLRRTAQQAAPDAESLDDGTIAEIYQGLGSAPAAIAEYATGTRYLGPVAGFAGVDALHDADQEPEDVALAAAKGALLGGAFKAADRSSGHPVPGRWLLSGAHRQRPRVAMYPISRLARQRWAFSVRRATAADSVSATSTPSRAP